MTLQRFEPAYHAQTNELLKTRFIGSVSMCSHLQKSRFFLQKIVNAVTFEELFSKSVLWIFVVVINVLKYITKATNLFVVTGGPRLTTLIRS